MTTFLLVCVFGISASSTGVERVSPIPARIYHAIWDDQAETDTHGAAVRECLKVHGERADLAWVDTNWTPTHAL